MPLGDTTHTIGQRLTDKGIRCAFIGKWHLSGTDYFDTGIPAPGWGRDYWYDMRDYLEELSPADRVRSREPRHRQRSFLDGGVLLWPPLHQSRPGFSPEAHE